MNADIVRAWIVANFIASAVSAIFGLLDYAVRSALEIGREDTTSVVAVTYVLTATGFATLSLAFYARMSGAVLVWIIPAMPQRMWLALHLTIGAAVGLCLGFAALIPTTEDSGPLDWRDAGELVFLFSVFSIGGSLLGAALGGLQSLVLKRAAQVEFWIAANSLAGAILGVTLLVHLLLVDVSQPLIRELALLGTLFLVGIVNAIVMLPAVLRLRPHLR